MPAYRSKHDRFWDACSAGDLAEVRRCAPDVDINWKKGASGHSGFHMAVLHGHASVVAYLLRLPHLEINAPIHSGRTALWMCLTQ